jgi:hypothetical protein
MGLDIKKVKDRLENKGKGGNPDRWSPQEGENPVRVLPHTLKYFTDTVDDIAFSYLIHFGVGPEGSKEAIVCPKTTNRKNRCPICEFIGVLKKSTDTKEQAMGSDMGIRKRYMINLIDLKDAETIAKGVQILECGPKIYEGIIQWANEKWGDPLDLETGRNLTIHKTIPPGGDKNRTEYKVEPDPNKSSIVAKLPKNWKEQLAKLETVFPQIKSYEEIKESLEGTVEYGSEEEAGTAVPGQEGVVSQTEQAAKNTEEKKAADAAKPASGKPDCFSKLFSNRNEKCIACPEKDPCKVEFLKP